MDRRSKKLDQIDKFVKDRGDLKKLLNEKSKRNDNSSNKSILSGRGDSDRNYTDKKPVTVTKKIRENKSKGTDANVDRSELSTVNTKKIPGFDKEIKLLDHEERKRIRDKYTLKLPHLIHSVPACLDKKDEGKPRNLKVIVRNVDKLITKQLNNKNELAQDMTNSSNYSGKSVKKPTKKTEKYSTVQRKPVIKTILSKSHSMKIYKAVTFIDQPKCKPTPLQIDIQTGVAKKTVTKLTDTSSLKTKMKPTVSRMSVMEKPVTVKKKSGIPRFVRNRHVTSPVSTDISENRSPPTEVARWAPSSINRHTKPYYEAWVNTTLAAISKNYNNNQLYLGHQNIIKTFQKAMEDRAESPDLVYDNYTDEKYTGKIKVRQRQSSNNQP